MADGRLRNCRTCRPQDFVDGYVESRIVKPSMECSSDGMPSFPCCSLLFNAARPLGSSISKDVRLSARPCVEFDRDTLRLTGSDFATKSCQGGMCGCSNRRRR
jgi:hypothetical protein